MHPLWSLNVYFVCLLLLEDVFSRKVCNNYFVNGMGYFITTI